MKKLRFRVNYMRVDGKVEFQTDFHSPRKVKKYLVNQLGLPHKKAQYLWVSVTDLKKVSKESVVKCA